MPTKLYKDTTTNKFYMLREDGAFEEVSVEPIEIMQKIKWKKRVDDSFDISKIDEMNFSLKDSIFVPIDGKDVEFVVEHIEPIDDGRKVYFVAKDIYCKSSMDDMNDTLQTIYSKMPLVLRDKMSYITHETSDGFYSRNKLSLLSYGNLTGEEGYCEGEDDVLFTGLQTEAERCKNIDGETYWYWTDSPNLSYSTTFTNVNNYGNLYNSYASSVIGVVPSFSIIQNTKSLP